MRYTVRITNQQYFEVVFPSDTEYDDLDAYQVALGILDLQPTQDDYLISEEKTNWDVKKEPALEFANQCMLFVEGESIHSDVEDDNEDILKYLDPERKALMIRFFEEE